MKPWYKRKKLWAAVLGCAGVIAHQYLGIPEADLTKITAIVMTYMFSQGIADNGEYK